MTNLNSEGGSAPNEGEVSNENEGVSFWDHIEELRGRLIFLAVLFISGAAVFFFFMDGIVQILKAPLSRHGIELYYREPSEKFFAYCGASLSCSLLLLIPAAGFQLHGFVMPALLGAERVIFSSLLLSGVLLFYGGALFAWFIMIPFVVDFFVNFASGDGVLPLWGISDYIGIIVAVMVVSGLCFELPVLLFALLSSGALPVRKAEGMRKYFIVAFFIIAAIVTPPDIISQIMVGLLLCAMFEITLIIAKISSLCRRKR